METRHIIIYFCAVNFEVPVFTVELKADFGSGEKGLVELSFRDFIMQYEQCDRFETAIQVIFEGNILVFLRKRA